MKELGCNHRYDLVRGDRGLSFPEFRVFRPDTYQGRDWRKEHLKELFPNEAKNLDRFYEFLETSIDLITLERHSAVSGSVRKIPLLLGMLLLWQKVKKYEKQSARALMDEYFTDEALKSFFMMILADMTILPEEYPALGIPFSNQEAAYDRRIPPKRALGIGPKNITYQFVRGGCGRLIEALEQVVGEHGGKIHTSSTVTKILTKDSSVTGVLLSDGTEHPADMVLASGGARECFFNLVGRDLLPGEYSQKIDDIPLMESVFMVHLGVSGDITAHQDVPLNYYYGTLNVTNGVMKVRDGLYHEGRDGYIIYIPSLHSPEMAPEGAHAVTVYTIAPYRIKDDWDGVKDEMTGKLIAEAEKIIPNLSAQIETSLTITPKDFGKLVHLKDHHSFGGYCPMLNRSGAPQETPIRGLWFIGSQSETGPGVWTQIISARNVVRRAKKDI
jgi:phytoene dehydrogenase-like protein